MPAYVDEEGVDPDHDTETFAEVVLANRHPLPARATSFVLRAGKELAARRKEAVVRFRATEPDAAPTCLRIGIDPRDVAPATERLGADDPDRHAARLGRPAIARVLLDLLGGDSTLWVRGDEAEAALRVSSGSWRPGGWQRRPRSARGLPRWLGWAARRRSMRSMELGPRDPEELDAAAGGSTALISPDTTIGPIHLTVGELNRSLDYYRRAVGLEVLEVSGGRASLGAGERELLVLVEEPGARPARRSSGLYHFALLVPHRRELAAWLAHAVRDSVPLVGLSDHFVSEALYLSDPDYHGIEIYWDRPREQWEGEVAARMTTLPLDAQDLLGELDDAGHASFDGLPVGTVMGHVHLKVADVPGAVRFYGDGLGFGVMATLGRQAVFLGAGGYHHHIAANTWESAGAGAPPPGSAALRFATIVVPDAGERERALARLAALGHQHRDDGADPIVVDPSGNPVALTVRAGPRH